MKLVALLALTLALGLLAPLPSGAEASAVAAADAPAVASRQVRLDGVAVRVRTGTTQVVTVNRTVGHHARVTLWGRERGHWVQRLRATDGRIGYGGLVRGVDRRQGTGTTPLGTYDLPWAFGQVPERAGWKLRYRQVRSGDYWVQDNASAYYNRYRNKDRGGFRWRLPASDPNSSERLTDYPVQYEWSIVIDYNPNQVRHRGSGIFLHVNGDGATAGCVSAPRRFIRTLMFRLDPDRDPVIAIGR